MNDHERDLNHFLKNHRHTYTCIRTHTHTHKSPRLSTDIYYNNNNYKTHYIAALIIA